MKTSTLSEVVKRQCAAHRPALNLKGFVQAEFGVNYRFFRWVATGKKRLPTDLLRALNNAHVRLFPTEPVFVRIPNYPVVIPLGVQPSDS